jgi:hypothetical protein
LKGGRTHTRNIEEGQTAGGYMGWGGGYIKQILYSYGLYEYGGGGGGGGNSAQILYGYWKMEGGEELILYRSYRCGDRCSFLHAWFLKNASPLGHCGLGAYK